MILRTISVFGQANIRCLLALAINPMHCNAPYYPNTHTHARAHARTHTHIGVFYWIR